MRLLFAPESTSLLFQEGSPLWHRLRTLGSYGDSMMMISCPMGRSVAPGPCGGYGSPRKRPIDWQRCSECSHRQSPQSDATAA
jgi:hypothetical protein